MLQTLEKVKKIILRNVTLIIGYLTNIIIIRKLSKKGVYWSSERPDIFTKNSLIYTNLQSHGQYQVFKSRFGFSIKLLIEYLIYATTKRNTRSDKKVKKSVSMTNKVIITKFIYIMLVHPSLEVINNFELVIKDVKIDIFTSSPTTVQCKICGVSKATKFISRKTNNKEMIREPETMWLYDIIYEEQGYNKDNFISYFQDLETGYNLVYIYRRFGNSLEIMKRAFKKI